MKQFLRLKECSDDELIMIIYDDQEHWQKEAIVYAKKLLKDRGISEEYSKARIKEITREVEILWKQELKERETESYGIISLVLISLFWPKCILRDWYLKREGYAKMRNQRLFAIATGMIMYFSFALHAHLTYDQKQIERIAEINRLSRQDSLALSKIDWSGKYMFIDSSVQSNEKVIWKLILNKEQGKHTGTLTIETKSKTIKISCIGLIKDDLMEFYPDTTYNLPDGSSLSYYDRLFTFGRDGLKIFTKWEKLNPMYSGKRKIEEYFKKSPNPKSPARLNDLLQAGGYLSSMIENKKIDKIGN